MKLLKHALIDNEIAEPCPLMAQHSAQTEPLSVVERQVWPSQWGTLAESVAVHY